MKIPLIKPYLPPETKDMVWKVLESGYLTEGPVTANFEAAVKNYIGCQHAIAVTSCTTGLEIALRALDIGPGDEVIVPSVGWATSYYPLHQYGLTESPRVYRRLFSLSQATMADSSSC